MIDLGKKNVLGIEVNAIDYEAAVQKVIAAAQASRKLSVTALAVHGVMTGVLDPVQARRLNNIDLVVPDGQPVRWALNLLYKCKLPDRCYGPTMTLKICERVAREGIPIYLYGSRSIVVESLAENLIVKFPGLIIAGYRPSLFRKTSLDEKREIVSRIHESGARITFLGLGCPRQEVWAYEYQNYLSMPLIAVGAAFDFHAGLTPQAPALLQNLGFEWMFRLLSNPRRLWKRYILLNPLFVTLLGLQLLRLRPFYPIKHWVPENQEMYG